LSDLDLPFVLTLGVSIVAVILTYIDMRRRLKQQQDFSKSFVKLVNTLREELKLFRKQSKGVSATGQELEKQKILAQKEQQQWNQLKDIAKGIGWILEHTEEDYEEE